MVILILIAKKYLDCVWSITQDQPIEDTRLSLLVLSFVCFFFKESGKVTHNLTLQTATRSSAVASEKEAFVTLYTAAKEIFNLRSVTTDGNMSIRAFMRGEGGVKHGLDVWHLCKNLGKNLARKAKTAVSA